ncbi:MAG TPA: hypothetical protein VIG33_10805 [Pseudobdellovibrionaceae bacterium]|jgi:hypothetical protein
MKSFLVVVLGVALFSVCSWAQEGNDQRTVSECASELKIKVWWDSHKYKAKKYCEEYSQASINCAINLMQAKQLTYTNFEKALKDCARTRK